MNNGTSLIFLVFLAVASGHSNPKLEVHRPLADLRQRLVAEIEMRKQVIDRDQNSQMAMVTQYLSMINDLKDGEVQTGEIGPNFNKDHFLGMIRRVINSSWQKRCKKISRDDDGYTKATEAKEQANACIDNWAESEGIVASYERALLTGDNKPIIKKICTKRSGFFACYDKYITQMPGCYFPSEMEIIRKIDTINKNMLDMICANDENDFGIFEVRGEGEHCLTSNRVKIMTCANKALYSVTQRILEKWIENEHFTFEMETGDCKAFDDVKSCFVSSVENCANPTVMNMISSAFQIVRNETKC